MEDKYVQADWNEICGEIKIEAQITQRLITTLSGEEGMSDLLLKQINNMVRREGNMIGHLNDYRKKNEDYRRLLSVKEMNISHIEKQLERQNNSLVVSRGKESELSHFITDLKLTIDELAARCAEIETMAKLKDSENSKKVKLLEDELLSLRKHSKQLEEKELKTRMLGSFSHLGDLASSTKVDCVRTSFSTEDLRNQSSERPQFFPLNFNYNNQHNDDSGSSHHASPDQKPNGHFGAGGGHYAYREGVPRPKNDAVLKAERRSTLLRRFEQTII